MNSAMLDFVVKLLAATMLIATYRCWAIKKDWLDHPNHRSSHFIPVPGGAGMVFLLMYSCSLVLALEAVNSLSTAIYWSCPLFIGVLGLLDDRFDLPRRWRFALYTLLLVSALLLWPQDLLLRGAGFVITAQWLLLPLALLILLWWVNLFNFMDGINGIAGLQAVFMLAAVLLLEGGSSALSQGLMLIVIAALLGFLPWNFPKARVFMGDAGSVFLGAFIGLVALQSSLSLWQWGIIAAVFWVDASYTLLVRLLSGQKWYQAHSSHAYQKLARRWQSHAKVVAAVVAVNVCWLLPLAYYAHSALYYAPLIMVLAWLPLVGFCYWLGAGKQG